MKLRVKLIESIIGWNNRKCKSGSSYGNIVNSIEARRGEWRRVWKRSSGRRVKISFCSVAKGFKLIGAGTILLDGVALRSWAYGQERKGEGENRRHFTRRLTWIAFERNRVAPSSRIVFGGFPCIDNTLHTRSYKKNANEKKIESMIGISWRELRGALIMDALDKRSWWKRIIQSSSFTEPLCDRRSFWTCSQRPEFNHVWMYYFPWNMQMSRE